MEPRNNKIIEEITAPEEINEEIKNTDEAVQTDEACSEKEAPKKRTRNPIKRMREGGMFTLGFKIIGWTFLASLIVYILSRFVTEFAEFWTKYPAHWIRFVLAKLTGWFPFSLAECIIVTLPVIAISYIVASSVSSRRYFIMYKSFNFWFEYFAIHFTPLFKFIISQFRHLCQ